MARLAVILDTLNSVASTSSVGIRVPKGSVPSRMSVFSRP